MTCLKGEGQTKDCDLSNLANIDNAIMPHSPGLARVLAVRRKRR
jgi:hypothetical protein